MILLVLVTIWIHKKFNLLALEKGYKGKKWGIIGAATYLVISFGSQLLIGVLIGLGILNINLDNFGSEILLGLLSYAIGGLCAYILYNNFRKKPDIQTDIENFGVPESQEREME